MALSRKLNRMPLTMVSGAEASIDQISRSDQVQTGFNRKECREHKETLNPQRSTLNLHKKRPGK